MILLYYILNKDHRYFIEHFKSSFIFASPKIGVCIYTNFPVFPEWIISAIEGLQKLHLTECVK